MSKKKQIPKEEWLDRLSTFSSGNRGRIASMTVAGKTLTRNTSFRDIEYDPEGKGDDLVIAMGTQESGFRHIVEKPKELNLYHKPDGEISRMEIVDAHRKVTVLEFD